MNTEQKLIDIVQDFEHAMLVTKTVVGGLDSRPMAVAQANDDGELWFVTNRHSGKMADLAHCDDVAVTMQGSRQFVSLHGKCQVVEDQQKIDALWSELWKVWFPQGKSDPAIVLLKFVPEHGEYWDNRGLSALKYLVAAGKAFFRGERAEVDESINATVKLQSDD